MINPTQSRLTSDTRPIEHRQFPVGYYSIHPNVSLNFQMNRWYSWTNDQGMLDEMRAAASQIHNYAEVKQVFLEMAEKAMAKGMTLRSAFYLRMAEFFMFAEDPKKVPTRNRFIKLILDHYQIQGNCKHLIPFQKGNLVAYRFTPEQPKGTFVIFGGFDSYIEEFFPILLSIRDAGYDVVCFEGPGQGSVLENDHLPMTPAWEIPVKTILDYFQLDDVTLVGISLGGYLSLRAAAYEPRIHRVVAWDIMEDAFEGALSQFNPAVRGIFKLLTFSGASGILNPLVKTAMRSSLVRQWGIKQGMHVFGVKSPYEMFRATACYQTRDISPLIRQDVLVLAGAEDHYVPVRLFYDQIQTLTHARSVTARLFTRDEQAQNHCQVGNIGLVIEVILNWVENIQHGSRAHSQAAQPGVVACLQTPLRG